MTAEFTRRREKTIDLVKDIPGFKCYEPEGAFYIFPDVSYYYGKIGWRNIPLKTLQILACIF